MSSSHSHSKVKKVFGAQEELSTQQQRRNNNTKQSNRSTTQQQQQKKRRKNVRFDSLVTTSKHGNDNNDDDLKKTTNRSNRSVVNKTFKEDFRGSRVFVKGIPDGVSWQMLKNHFRKAGEVVFASVSIDRETGLSKGSGIVQFETTDMAQNAISIMRHHPLEGSTLFVRHDVQEGRNGTFSPKKQSFKEKSQEKRDMWKCANTNDNELSDNDRLDIYDLLLSRDEARTQHDVSISSDPIREKLMRKHDVHLDDRLRLWWTRSENTQKHVTSASRTATDEEDNGIYGRRHGKEWRQILTIPENDACVDPDHVNTLLKRRDVARSDKDFETADSLLEEARTSPKNGELCLRIHDESRTWRIWTEHSPSRKTKMSTVTGIELCLDLVTKYEPDKLEEVKTLLTKFQGRAWSILKKLKKRYNGR